MMENESALVPAPPIRLNLAKGNAAGVEALILRLTGQPITEEGRARLEAVFSTRTAEEQSLLERAQND